MDKKRKKTKSTREREPWKGQLSDAMRLSAIHWFALNMEQLALEIYATDRNKFEPLLVLLQTQAGELFEFGRDAGDLADEDCGDGYILCKDGLCAPMCDAHGGGDTNQS